MYSFWPEPLSTQLCVCTVLEVKALVILCTCTVACEHWLVKFSINIKNLMSWQISLLLIKVVMAFIGS